MPAAASYPPEQLMKLGEPETRGVLDHHDGCLGHVDADLDHGGGDEEPGLAGCEALHGAVLLAALHAPVHEVDHGAEVFLERGEAILRGGKIGILGDLDQRTDPIGASTFSERAADGADHLVEPA